MLINSKLTFQNIEEWELSFVEYWFLKYESETLPEIRKSYDKSFKKLTLNNCFILPEHYSLLKYLARDLNRSDIFFTSKDKSGIEDQLHFANGDLMD